MNFGKVTIKIFKANSNLSKTYSVTFLLVNFEDFSPNLAKKKKKLKKSSRMVSSLWQSAL